MLESLSNSFSYLKAFLFGDGAEHTAPPAIDAASSALAAIYSSAHSLVAATPSPATSASALQTASPESISTIWHDHAAALALPHDLAALFQHALDKAKPLIDYIAAHPWVLLPLLLPLLEAWLVVIGFEAGGIVKDSVAAGMMARVGNVPKGSWISFLQRHGTRSFAGRAMRMGGVGLVLAVVLAGVGMLLVENNVTVTSIEQGLSDVWEKKMKVLSA
ncbi:hypothetical protein EDC01DRAFT_733151 [Geopyxis carbonaria]|nr:hypothetical protein EDC01DRAFT_733151 [Geopyxis carbonaria]